MSRRSVLGSLAAAPALGSKGLSTKRCTPDVQLLRFGYEFIEVAGKIDDAINGKSELTDELLDHLSSLDAKIIATPAITIDGLCVKAKAACWARLDDLDPANQPTTDKRQAHGIVDCARSDPPLRP